MAYFNQQETIQPLFIAGPCAAESEEQVFETARALKHNADLFRVGIWKPRTKPNTFAGKGENAFPWLYRIKTELNLPIAIEVATARHAELAIENDIDVVWLGARTTANPFAIDEILCVLEGTHKPLLIKNPINPDIDLWTGAVERCLQKGITDLALVHRGFSVFGNGFYRNVPLWHIPIEMRRRFPTIPIICDPSHMGGQRSSIYSLAQQAFDLDYNGQMIECHISPSKALSDAQQQLSPEEYLLLKSQLKVRTTHKESDELYELRKQIDELDETLVGLLNKRMSVCRRIGEYKKEHNLTVLQSKRYKEILDKYIDSALANGLSPQFIEQLFEIIHKESVDQQLSLLKKDSQTK